MEGNLRLIGAQLYLHPVRGELQKPAFATVRGSARRHQHFHICRQKAMLVKNLTLDMRTRNENVGIQTNHLAFVP